MQFKDHEALPALTLSRQNLEYLLNELSGNPEMAFISKVIDGRRFFVYAEENEPHYERVQTERA